MPTLTAINPRPYVLEKPVVKIELVAALPEDLKQTNFSTNTFELRYGMIYWIRSNINGKIESTPYVITNNTSHNQLKELLDNKMVFVSKNPFI